MDDKELGKLLLLRAEMAESLAEVDEKIRAAVLENKQSVSAFGVKASYYKPSRKYDYALGAAGHPNVTKDLIKKFTTTRESVAWKQVCEEADIPIEEIPFEDVPERVVVK
ncbi:hypothetical protein KQH61_06130 [bacterium]|nr:hypothetical protein [bacterium]